VLCVSLLKLFSIYREFWTVFIKCLVILATPSLTIVTNCQVCQFVTDMVEFLPPQAFVHRHASWEKFNISHWCITFAIVAGPQQDFCFLLMSTLNNLFLFFFTEGLKCWLAQLDKEALVFWPLPIKKYIYSNSQEMLLLPFLFNCHF